MIRCRTCLIPDTRPDTAFVNGECSACVNFRRRREIDWQSRGDELVRMLEASAKNGSGFSCIVPSSGGKDSHAQVLRIIELGFRPDFVLVSVELKFLNEQVRIGRAMEEDRVKVLYSHGARLDAAFFQAIGF